MSSFETITQCPAPGGREHIAYKDGHIICKRFGLECQYLPAHLRRAKANLQLEYPASRPTVRASSSWQLQQTDPEYQYAVMLARHEAKQRLNAEQVSANADVWEFTDFDVVQEPDPLPSIGEIVDGVCLWRPGSINGMHGKRGAAKTWVLDLLMVREMHKGNHALLLDFEMGRSRVEERMRLLGASHEQLRTLLHHTKPRGSLSAQSLDALADRISRTGGVLTVVGIDTVTKAMRLTNTDSNNADDVTSWFDALPVPIVTAFPTAAAVLLDHVVKDGDTSLDPIASQAKTANVDTQYLVRSIAKFSKKRDGHADLICAKSRDGDYNEGEPVARFHGGPSGFSFTLRALTATTDDDARDDDLTIDLSSVPDEDQIWDELDGHMPDGILQTDFCGRGAAGQHRRDLLFSLEAKGRARKTPGGRGGRGSLWFTVH